MRQSTILPRFYVYVLRYPPLYPVSHLQRQPFYVGKGMGRRILQHESEAQKGCDCRKCGVITTIWAYGQTVDKDILLYTDDELGALDYEAHLIAEYRRKRYPLVNYHRSGTPQVRADRYVEPIAREQIMHADYVAERDRTPHLPRPEWRRSRGKWQGLVRWTDNDGERCEQVFEHQDKGEAVRAIAAFYREQQWIDT